MVGMLQLRNYSFKCEMLMDKVSLTSLGKGWTEGHGGDMLSLYYYSS